MLDTSGHNVQEFRKLVNSISYLGAVRGEAAPKFMQNGKYRDEKTIGNRAGYGKIVNNKRRIFQVLLFGDVKFEDDNVHEECCTMYLLF